MRREYVLFLLFIAQLPSVRPIDLREQQMMEATALLRGGSSVGMAKLMPVPSNVLESAEFSSLLSAYAEDIVSEIGRRECRYWIDVEKFRANRATAWSSGPVIKNSMGFSRHPTPLPQPKPTQWTGNGRCSSLNKEFGVAVTGSSKPSAASHLTYTQCTAAPWFLDVEVAGIETKETDSGSNYFVVQLNYSGAAPSAVSRMPTVMPLRLEQLANYLRGGWIPKRGDNATIVCLGKGEPLIFAAHTDDEEQYAEFLPGPWSVEVDVEFYRDVLRPMGVGVRLHLKDNLSVTLPPLRVLPFNSGKLSTEQWLLLELAELHTQRQWQSNSEDETGSTEKDKPGEWATFQRDAAFEALSVGRCRLKRGRRADDPVLLDCLPNISNRSKRELAMNGLNVVRRGAISLALAAIPAMRISAAFHSLIHSSDSTEERADSLVTGLSLFNIRRSWDLTVSRDTPKTAGYLRKVLQLSKHAWTAKQEELLGELSSELLQMYARGAQGVAQYSGKLIFEASDSTLVVRVPVSSLSFRRRLRLGLLFEDDLELVFTFTDMGGKFHPFQRVPSSEEESVKQSSVDSGGAGHNSEDKSAGRNGGSKGEEPTRALLSGGLHEKTSKCTGASSASGGEVSKEEREPDVSITYLQLLWQKVAEPHHRELRHIAVGNILADVGTTVALMVASFIIAKMIGNFNGRTVADILRERRAARLSHSTSSEIAIFLHPSEKSETKNSPFGASFGERSTAKTEEHVVTKVVLPATVGADLV
ncbi:hypothetical protein, conserved [Eimeria necatrix]|uniref:Transmembrane protein n=1 Tax=Eimeria necatrix TaxID=51315 RepID=U6N8N9_9EIME|nr:hypothetical protein, conserved [Eimeria necatrix]CDJ70236.1 hypothetical protein, conserved [Eimeria necatrix]